MKLKEAIISIAIVVIAVILGNIFTSKSVNSSWYESIKPSITPPNYIFPIVWTILFILIAISLYFALTSGQGKKEKGRVLVLFSINLILNVLWSFLFFYMRNVKIAFIDLILLWLSILYLIIFLWKIEKKASLLLLPYLIWVGFAGVLNAMMLSH